MRYYKIVFLITRIKIKTVCYQEPEIQYSMELYKNMEIQVKICLTKNLFYVRMQLEINRRIVTV